MSTKHNDLLKRLRETFRIEAQEHINTIASALIELEQSTSSTKRQNSLESAFRAAHSLKGAARAVNVADMASLCHTLEDVFSALRKSEIAPHSNLFDLLHRTVDSLTVLLGSIDSTTTPKPRISDLIQLLSAVLKDSTPIGPEVTISELITPFAPQETPIPVVEEKHRMPETVRVSITKLDSVLLHAEEMLAVKHVAAQHAIGVRQAWRLSSEGERRQATLRNEVSVIEKFLQNREQDDHLDTARSSLARLVDFLTWNSEFIDELEAQLSSLSKAADRDQWAIDAMVDSLRDEATTIAMQPFSTLLELFPRLVRELSREQGKDVDLSILGEAIEIDRRVLEKIKDPLIHLIRNGIDHGIELPTERVLRGKQARGMMSIAVSVLDGNHIELAVSDDGNGMDPKKLRVAAERLQLMMPEKVEQLSDDEVIPLIFQMGFSTSPAITTTSGRGVGLAVLKEAVDSLNGNLSVETKFGFGTHFRINLPLTHARFHAVAIRVGEQVFAVPASQVERVIRLKRSDIRTIENRETVSINEKALSLVHLYQVLGLNIDPDTRFVVPAIVLNSINQSVVFVVDQILHEQEVVAKGLGQQLAGVRNVTGATVLADGKLVLILNVQDLIDSAVRVSQAGTQMSTTLEDRGEVRKKSILVAEDSITSRILLKHILESAGYDVETSVDGVDAFTKLRSKHFDAVVSDVDMPRMNGFGLTARIRADKNLSTTPVILVTALDSREDREHGIDVGANAYIVKGSFDQSDLLEAIHRSV